MKQSSKNLKLKKEIRNSNNNTNPSTTIMKIIDPDLNRKYLQKYLFSEFLTRNL